MLDNAIDLIKENIIQYGMKIFICIIVLVVGFKIVNVICKHIKKIMEKKNVEHSIVHFTNSLLKIGLKLLLVLAIFETLGTDATSIVAILGAASFAVGLALQGSLSNFAAGVIILVLRPFRVGNYVQISGLSGTVASIEIFSTVLKTPDNKTIILPNGPIIGSNIINYSIEETRRVDFVFGIDYSSDIKKAKEVMREVAYSHELVLKDPEVFVGVTELADSSVNFVVRAWVKSEDYWTVHFDITESMKLRLNEENIGIPYPHIQIVRE